MIADVSITNFNWRSEAFYDVTTKDMTGAKIPIPNKHAPVVDPADPGDDALDRALVLARAITAQKDHGRTARSVHPRTLFV